MLTIGLVYPETADRSLESIDVLFSTSSPFNWKMEQQYREHGDILREMGLSLGSGKMGAKAHSLKNESMAV